jgi:hypothetical protein
MKKAASHILIVLFGLVFCCSFGVEKVQGMTADDVLLYITPMANSTSIVFTTEGSSFAPVITVTGNPSILWVWADGTTSNSATPNKNYGSPGKRLNRLQVKPWSALQRINIGYDAGDDGSSEIEPVPDQHVSAVRGLHLVAPSLAQWCSSYNLITSLDFRNFANLDTIECFNSQSLRTVNLANTPKLRRVCFEDCNLESLDLSGSPNLEDLRGAANDFPTINFGATGAHIWHICVVNNPQLTNQTMFADLSPFPNLSDLLIWSCNQTGTLRLPLTNSLSGFVNIMADDNHYTSVDLSGALANSDAEAFVAFNRNNLTSINITGCSQITQLYLENNNFDSASLDTVLATLDALGRNENTLAPGAQLRVDLRGNATPSATGYAHALSLAGKGWTVLAEGWTVEPLQPFNGEQRLDFSTNGEATSMRCDFGRALTNTAVWHWSDGTTTAAASGENAVKNVLGPGPHAHYLIISDGAALTRFGASDGGGAGNLTTMLGFENCPSLRVLYAYDESGLTSLGRTNATKTREYHLMGTALSPLALDQVFADAVASNVWGGSIWSASGTAASEADRTVLLSRGWSLYD